MAKTGVEGDKKMGCYVCGSVACILDYIERGGDSLPE
jgi:hypothetical protein